jgi:RNA polymerase sigma-70 factor (ECF subfamily)
MNVVTLQGTRYVRDASEKPTLATNGQLDPRDEVTAYLTPLRAFGISLTGNRAAADDLVQDTILKAWSNIDKFQPGTNMQAWLFTILRNTFYSGRRKHRREVPDPEGLHAATLFELPAHDGRLAFRDFHRAFAQLSAEHREVLLLVGASGYSTEETAEMIGTAIGTVKSRTSRARRRLAELMGLEDAEPFAPLADPVTRAVMGGSLARLA